MAKRVGIVGVLVILMGLSLWAMNLLEILERHFIFFPTAELEITPADLGIPYEDVYFTTPDGLELNGWFVPAPAREPVPDPDSGTAAYLANANTTLLWFHGNGGNMGHRVHDIALLHHLLGVKVFIFDYRGYGRSEGKPSERGVYQDSRAALAYLGQRGEGDASRVFYFGRSIGAAVAVELAVEHPPAGMVLFSPFTSIADMGQALYPYSPVRALAGGRFDTLSRIGGYHGPLLVIHGTADEIVPVEQGRQLYKASNPPKKLHEIPGATHNNGLGEAGPELWEVLGEFLAPVATDD